MGDALTDQLIRGDMPEEKLPSSMTRIVCREFPPLPEQLPEVAEGVRMRMADQERTARGKLSITDAPW